MTSPTPSPSAPQEVPQWALNAILEAYPELRTGLSEDTAELYRVSGIITRHAQPAAPTVTPGITTERDVRNTVTPWSHPDEVGHPPAAPQEVPQWAKEAALAIHKSLQGYWVGSVESYPNLTADFYAIIHRHAQPALTAATEEAERLRGEVEQTRSNLYAGLDRDKDDTTTPNLATVAANAICSSREQLADAKRECAHWKWNTETWSAMAVELGNLAGVADNEVPWFDKAKAAISAMTYRHGIITVMAASELELRAQLATAQAWGEKAREAMGTLLATHSSNKSWLENIKMSYGLDENGVEEARALLASHPSATRPKDGPGDAAMQSQEKAPDSKEEKP